MPPVEALTTLKPPLPNWPGSRSPAAAGPGGAPRITTLDGDPTMASLGREMAVTESLRPTCNFLLLRVKRRSLDKLMKVVEYK